MNETDFMYFSELARTLNFSRAADRLFITQSALSRCIAKIEKELSVKLFERDRHDVRLTAAGEVLLENWCNVEKAHAMLREALKDADRNSAREMIRIGIQHGHLIPGYMRDRIRDFSVSSSPVSIEVTSLPYQELFRELREGMIDIALGFMFPFSDFSGIGSKHLHSEECSIHVPKSHPLASVTDREERLNMLRTMDLLCTGKEHQANFFPFLLSLCRKNGFEPKGVKYYPSYMDLANAFLMEKGFLVINRTELMKDGCFIPLEKGSELSFRAFWREGHLHPVVEDFIKTL